MTRLAFLHPSRKRLLEWLDHDVADAADDRSGRAIDAINTHVEQCERCADRLEDLSEADELVPDLDENIGSALREVYVAPPGINDRVMKVIDERERADRELNLFLGLFAIATDAADLMLPDDSSDTNRGDHRRNREE